MVTFPHFNFCPTNIAFIHFWDQEVTCTIMFKVPVIKDKLGFSSKAFGDLLFILKLHNAEIQSRSKLTYFRPGCHKLRLVLIRIFFSNCKQFRADCVLTLLSQKEKEKTALFGPRCFFKKGKKAKRLDCCLGQSLFWLL